MSVRLPGRICYGARGAGTLPLENEDPIRAMENRVGIRGAWIVPSLDLFGLDPKQLSKHPTRLPNRLLLRGHLHA